MAANKASSNTLSKKISEFFKRKNADGEKLVLQQEQETGICTVAGQNLSYRYGYARANESKLLGDKGQDYLTLYNQGGKFVFVLCDGVSQSFFGDIAAKYLGDSLLEWFNSSVPGGMNPEPIRQALNIRLDQATQAASELVDKHQLAADLPAMFKTVLEEKRNMGSETTFIAARIDLPGADYPEGRAVFAWLGDSRLRIWNARAEVTANLTGEFKTMQRWSSKRGSIGSMVHVYVSNIRGKTGIRRILAYTDGLSSIDNNTAVLNKQELQGFIDKAGDMPTSDDIALIEILLEPWNNQI